jgi:hypothetical protein
MRQAHHRTGCCGMGEGRVGGWGPGQDRRRHLHSASRSPSSTLAWCGMTRPLTSTHAMHSHLQGLPTALRPSTLARRATPTPVPAEVAQKVARPCAHSGVWLSQQRRHVRHQAALCQGLVVCVCGARQLGDDEQATDEHLCGVRRAQQPAWQGRWRETQDCKGVAAAFTGNPAWKLAPRSSPGHTLKLQPSHPQRAWCIYSHGHLC